MDTISSVFKRYVRRPVSSSGRFIFKLNGVGCDLPSEMVQGNEVRRLNWKWHPQLLVFYLVGEAWNRRLDVRQRKSPFLVQILWKIWNSYLLLKQGYLPLAGLLSGRRATFIIHVSGSGKNPQFLGLNNKLLIMRSAGKSGLLLNDYSNFLEIKLVRNEEWSFITRAFITGSSSTLSANSCFNSTSIAFPNSKFRFKEDARQSKQPLVDRREFHDVFVRNGHTVVDSSKEVIYPNKDNFVSNYKFSPWPKYLWPSAMDGLFYTAPVTERSRIDSGHFISVINNLYHFIEEVLPQVSVHNEECIGHDLFVGGNIDKVLLDLLNEISYTPVHHLQVNQEVGFERLYLTEFADFRHDLMAGKTQVNTETIRHISRALKSLNIPNFDLKSPGRKVLVGRRKGLLRYLVNKDMIYELLHQRGFEVVYFEELDLIQRIEILQQTSILVGESGAGLANSYLMNDKSTVIELRHPSMFNSQEHLTLSETKGIEYKIVMGRPPRAFEMIKHGRDSFLISPEQVTDMLDRVDSNEI